MTTEKVIGIFTLAIPVVLVMNTVLLMQVFTKMDKLEHRVESAVEQTVSTTCVTKKDNYWYGVEKSQTMECNSQ